MSYMDPRPEGLNTEPAPPSVVETLRTSNHKTMTFDALDVLQELTKWAAGMTSWQDEPKGPYLRDIITDAQAVLAAPTPAAQSAGQEAVYQTQRIMGSWDDVTQAEFARTHESRRRIVYAAPVNASVPVGETALRSRWNRIANSEDMFEQFVAEVRALIAALVNGGEREDARRMRTLCRLLDAADDLGNGFPGEVHHAFQEGSKVVRDTLDRFALPEDGEHAADAPQVDEHDVRLRRLLCAENTGGLGYFDDGEMQDNSAVPAIDFKRQPWSEIAAALVQRNKNAALTSPAKVGKQEVFRCATCRDGELLPQYGVAPHKCFYKIPGAVIGESEMLPQSEWPANFTPDEENPQCGTWTCPDCGPSAQMQNGEWENVRVKNLQPLLDALARAEEKGYLPDAMVQEWTALEIGPAKPFGISVDGDAPALSIDASPATMGGDEREAFEKAWNALLRNYEHEGDAFLMGWKLWKARAALSADGGEDKRDAERLDFMIEQQAWVQWTVRDGSIRQCQVYAQDEDENYHILSGEDRFFSTPREAIDAAIAAKAKGDAQ